MVRRIARTSAVACLVGILAVFCWRPAIRLLVPPADGPVREMLRAEGGALLARDGSLLRLFPSPSGDLRLNTPLASVPRVLVDALLAAEDHSFREHGGFDPVAIARAAWDNLLQRRIVSGASTITQQLIRISRPRPRSLAVKLSELLLAARLEQQMSKDEILEAYLNLAPMAGNLRGVWAGAFLLFGKEPAGLDLAESATLAALPQSPSRLHPYLRGGATRLKTRRNWVLGRMAKLGLASSADCAAATRRPLGIRPWRIPLDAPHFAEWVHAEIGTPTGRLVTSLDPEIQRSLAETL
ncbi:MAG TPA: transglycosylase domain-containing protein, partial [Candidatus Ozemobacteraceae bacterium]